MKVLILGGTGLIGTEIATQAAAAGHEVTVFSRGIKKSSSDAKIRHIYGNRKESRKFECALREQPFDAVIDMVAFCPEDAAQTLALFDGQAEQIIFASSVAAYQQPYHHFPLREKDAVLRMDKSFGYGFQKAEMERFLAAFTPRSHLTVLRPALTYGLGGHNVGILRQNANLIKRVQKDKPLLLFGDGLTLCNFTFVQDMASAFVLCLANAQTYGHCFHIASDQANTWMDLYSTISSFAGKTPSFCYLPSQVLYQANSVLFGHILYEKQYCSLYDCSAFRGAVPTWKCRIHLKEGMEQLYTWWESEDFPVDVEKDWLEDGLCDTAQKVGGLIMRNLNSK